MLPWSVNQDLPVSIRYPRGGAHALNGSIHSPIELGKSEIMFKSENTSSYDVCIFALGTMAWDAYTIAQNLVKENISVAAVNLRFAKPLDEETVLQFAKVSKQVVIMEEGCETGGINSTIIQLLVKNLDTLPRIQTFAIPDEFVEHGSVDKLKSDIDLLPDQMEASIKTKVLA